MCVCERTWGQSEFSQPKNENESQSSLPSASERRATSGAWTTCSVKGMLTDLSPGPSQQSPPQPPGESSPESEGSSGQASGNPDVRVPGWEGPENNAGATAVADEDAVGQAHFQAALQSLASAWRPAPDPGPALASRAHRKSGPWLFQAASALQPPPDSFWKRGVATGLSIVVCRENLTWVHGLTLPPTSCVTLASSLAILKLSSHASEMGTMTASTGQRRVMCHLTEILQ